MIKLNKTERILAQDVFVSNNSWETNLNGNDLILGSTGAGKTRGYIIPNILQASGESMVIADTKGNLIDMCGDFLKKKGYRILEIDFKQMNSSCRWNPMEYISFDEDTNAYSEKDIMELAKELVPDSASDDPFWYDAARQYLGLLISYVMDFLPDNEHSLYSVNELFRIMDSNEFGVLMQETVTYHRDSTSARIWESIQSNRDAIKMHHSITGILSSYMHNLVLSPAIAMYRHTNKFRFSELGETKTALFVDISDADRSMDGLIGVFYAQLFQDLISFADLECEGCRLPVPTRVMMDDFATNYRLPEFDNLISVFRSREIYVSIILQSITQLYAMYGRDRASTIIDNCDHVLYLGGVSLETVEYVATRADLPEYQILNQPLDDAYLFTRGEEPRKVKKFDLTTHSNYKELKVAEEVQK